MLQNHKSAPVCKINLKMVYKNETSIHKKKLSLNNQFTSFKNSSVIYPKKKLQIWLAEKFF